MQRLSDDDIDKLFKQAAEQQRPKFDASDWDDLAKRLDKPSQPRPGYYVWASVAVVVGVLIWLGLTVMNPAEPPDSALSTVSTIQKDASIKLSEPRENSEVNVPSGSNKDFSARELNDTKTGHSSAMVKENRSGKTAVVSVEKKSDHIRSDVPLEKSLVSSNTRKPVTNQSRSTSEVIPNGINEFSSEKEEQVAAPDRNKNVMEGYGLKVPAGASATTNGVDKNALPLSDTQAEDDITSSARASQSKDIESTSVEETFVADSTGVVPVNEKKKKKHSALTSEADSVLKQTPFYRLGIRGTASPDFSAEQFGSVDKAGVNYGVVVEYFMFRNVSISTGAIWSRKFYSAEDVEYSGYQASHVQGDCRMWDIPLNVNYYFNPEKSYSFFASAGLSSYLMNEENYVFEVETGYGTHTYSQQVIKENNEWFKTLNLSVGLQKQFNRRFAIQIEPFVKVPLAGVGAGNISLSSFGSFLSLRYNFLNSKK